MSKIVNWAGLGVAVGIVTGVLTTTLAYGRSDGAREQLLQAHTSTISSNVSKIAEGEKRDAVFEARLSVIEANFANLSKTVDKADAKLDRVLTVLEKK